MPTPALFCAADEGTTENLRTDCPRLRQRLCTLPEGRREGRGGEVESDVNWRSLSDKQGLFTTGS